eukprot:gb/GECG01001970.1/.p1 GENE.gb/GECG01001970.1/~~gb/GECG01001970.1/.p1  ORF type:complete len:158 (+),score=35.38 gb/GECG01001970.1/:1-474(+)
MSSSARVHRTVLRLMKEDIVNLGRSFRERLGWRKPQSEKHGETRSRSNTIGSPRHSDRGDSLKEADEMFEIDPQNMEQWDAASKNARVQKHGDNEQSKEQTVRMPRVWSAPDIQGNTSLHCDSSEVDADADDDDDTSLLKHGKQKSVPVEKSHKGKR